MRRKEKEIKDEKEIISIIQKAKVCRIGLSENNKPYIVPMNFGYRNDCLYFHCAKEGRKIDIIKKNNKVCFEIDIDHEIINTNRPCNWSSTYTSVIGNGKASIIEADALKKEALNIIIDHYSPGTTYDYPDDQVKKVSIIKIKIEDMTGKKS
jgi:nitroimidazol reductase NimA-like FMN-containing flavoprotein (pyridoxamine 5'-phosphate oxidase superfamily)